MKKLVVLMLVLGMASLASAVLVSSDTVTTGSVVWSVVDEQLIGVNATGTVDAEPYWIDGVTSPWDNIVVGIGPMDGSKFTGSFNDAAGDAADVSEWAPGGFNASGYDGSDLVLPNLGTGQWFQFDLSGLGTIGIGDYSSFDAVGTITVTPEPMTMVLLGLGGLFLRRRK